MKWAKQIERVRKKSEAELKMLSYDDNPDLYKLGYYKALQDMAIWVQGNNECQDDGCFGFSPAVQSVYPYN